MMLYRTSLLENIYCADFKSVPQLLILDESFRLIRIMNMDLIFHPFDEAIQLLHPPSISLVIKCNAMICKQNIRWRTFTD